MLYSTAKADKIIIANRYYRQKYALIQQGDVADHHPIVNTNSSNNRGIAIVLIPLFFSIHVEHLTTFANAFRESPGNFTDRLQGFSAYFHPKATFSSDTSFVVQFDGI